MQQFIEDMPLTNEILSQLPKAISATDQSYSLEQDMLLGWAPKVKPKGYLSLKFSCTLNDSLIQMFHNKEELIYLGFRPLNTAQLHREYSNALTYNFRAIKQVPKMKHHPFLGMNPAISCPLQFNSVYESGNLDIVLKVSEMEYDLFMRVDSNTKGHTSWYNFTLKGLQRGQRVKLNICNFSKCRSLYERGMHPYIMRSSTNEWKQGGENVSYQRKIIRYVETTKQYKCLSFELEGQDENELIQVAYCIPYTYSQMLQVVNLITKNCNFVDKSHFCDSLSGIPIPLLTFQNNTLLNKKIFVIQARIHPGESNSSWVMQGLLDFLSSDQAEDLLNKCIIKVIPMLNPDGVIMGNYRTGCAGKDLNRRFKTADPILFPSVHAMKMLIKDLHSIYGKSLIGFLDLHGHSVKKNAFFYGPEFPLWNPNYYKCRLLARTLSSQTPMFRYYSCIYRISDQKKSTARGVFSEIYDLVNCFTMETSNGCYYTNTQSYEFNTQSFIDMGRELGKALNSFIEMLEEVDQIFDEQQPARKTTRPNAQKIINKKRSLTVHNQDKITAIRQVYENTKFHEIFEEMKNEQMDQSLSEGGSDSESESDDYSEYHLDELREEVYKQRPEMKKYLFERQSPNKIKKQSTELNRRQMAQTIQVSTLIQKQPSDKKISISKSKVPEIISKTTQLKEIKTFRATFKQHQQTFIEQVNREQVESPVQIEKFEYNLQISHEMDQLQKFQQTQQLRPCSSKLMGGETDFLPLNYDFQKSQNGGTFHFKGHNRLKSNQSIKRITDRNDKSDRNKIKKKTNPPPLLAQLGITTKPKQSMIQQPNLRNLEKLGILVKPKLFIQKNIEESPDIYQTILQGPIQITDSCRPLKSKAVVPSSFYSVNKHLMNRQSVVRNKI